MSTQSIATIKARIKVEGLCKIEQGFVSRLAEKILKPNLLRCDWKDLQGKKIHNENLLITDFHDVHPFPNSPIFDNAKTVFLQNTYHYFHFYWLNEHTFKSKPTFYIDGYINYAHLLEQGFKIYLTEQYYACAKRISPNNDSFEMITLDDYNKLLSEYKSEKIICSDYKE